MGSSKGNQEVDNGIGGLWHYFVTACSGLGIDLAAQIRQATRARHTPVLVRLCVPVSELWWVSPPRRTAARAGLPEGRCWYPCPCTGPGAWCAAVLDTQSPFPLPRGLTLSPLPLGLFCDLPEVFFWLKREERGKERKLSQLSHCLVSCQRTCGDEVWGVKGKSITIPNCFLACNCCEPTQVLGEWCKAAVWNFPPQNRRTHFHMFSFLRMQCLPALQLVISSRELVCGSLGIWREIG